MTSSSIIADHEKRLRDSIDMSVVAVPKRAKTLSEFVSPEQRLEMLLERRANRFEAEKTKFTEQRDLKERLEHQLKDAIEKKKLQNKRIRDNDEDVDAMKEYVRLTGVCSEIEAKIKGIVLIEPVEWTAEETIQKKEIEEEFSPKPVDETPAAELKPIDVVAHETSAVEQIIKKRMDEFMANMSNEFHAMWVKIFEEMRQRLASWEFFQEPKEQVTTESPKPIVASKSYYYPLSTRFLYEWAPEAIEETDVRLTLFLTYVAKLNSGKGNFYNQEPYTEKDFKRIKSVLDEPTFSSDKCIFCQSESGAQFPPFEDKQNPLSQEIMYRSNYKAAMVGCHEKHWCHLGCAAIYKSIWATENDVEMDIDDTLLERNRKCTWMQIPCPRCKSCFTPVSLVSKNKQAFPLFPTFQSVIFNSSMFYEPATVSEPIACAFCKSAVHEPSPSLVSHSNQIVRMHCDGYAHKECAEIQIMLNQKFMCGAKHV